MCSRRLQTAPRFAKPHLAAGLGIQPAVANRAYGCKAPPRGRSCDQPARAALVVIIYELTKTSVISCRAWGSSPAAPAGTFGFVAGPFSGSQARRPARTQTGDGGHPHVVARFGAIRRLRANSSGAIPVCAPRATPRVSSYSTTRPVRRGDLRRRASTCRAALCGPPQPRRHRLGRNILAIWPSQGAVSNGDPSKILRFT